MKIPEQKRNSVRIVLHQHESGNRLLDGLGNKQQRAWHQGNLCCVLVVVQEREKGLDLGGGHGLERKTQILESLQRFIKMT